MLNPNLNTKIKHQAGLGGATHERGKSFIDAAELILNNLKPAQIKKINNIPKDDFPLRHILLPNTSNKQNFDLLQDYIKSLKDYWENIDNKDPNLAALEKTLIETIMKNVYFNKPKSFKKVKDELDNAENHVNWKKREVKETSTNSSQSSMARIETPISKFTPELTREWLKITTPEKPSWFKALPKWEQQYFIKRIEEWKTQALQTRANLGDFLGPVPTTIRRYPGAPNAYVTSVTLTKNGDQTATQTFTKIRSGVIAPAKMKAGKEKIEITKKNLEQLIVVAIQEKIKEISSKPGFDINKPIDLPILFQTLYSPPFQPPGAGNNPSVMAALDLIRKELQNPNEFIKKHKIDTHKIETQKVGSNKVEIKEITFSKIDLLYSNRAVNNARGLTWIINLFSRQGRESRKSDKVLAEYVDKLKGTPDYAFAKAALESYQKMPYIGNTIGRHPTKSNALAEMAALEQIITGKVGIRVGSCVSGKDREEMVTEIAIAQQQFYLEYGKFPPPYNAKGEDKILRQEFAEMVARQYLTGHGHELAAENSKGCDGLKNIVDVLGKDVCAKIREISPEYGIDPKVFDPIKAVQKVAGLNKLSIKKINIKIDEFKGKFTQSESFNIFKQDKQTQKELPPQTLRQPDASPKTMGVPVYSFQKRKNDTPPFASTIAIDTCKDTLKAFIKQFSENQYPSEFKVTSNGKWEIPYLLESMRHALEGKVSKELVDDLAKACDHIWVNPEDNPVRKLAKAFEPESKQAVSSAPDKPKLDL